MFLFLAFVVLAVLFTFCLTSSQKNKIMSTTYFDKVLVDGKTRTLQKFKCPSCGNKDLNYQMASSSATTIKHGSGKISTTSISNAKYAVCNKCGTSFQTMRKPTPVANFFASFFLTLFIFGIGSILYGIINMF